MGSPITQIGRARNNENQTEVTLTHALLMQQHETTQAEWIAAGFPNPSKKFSLLGEPKVSSDCLQEDCPVGNVNFYEAAAYANARSRLETRSECYELADCLGAVGGGHDEFSKERSYRCATVRSRTPSIYDCDGYRLPMESEWEYAARAGTTTATYGGDISPPPSGDFDRCYADPGLDRIAWYCGNAKSGPQSIMRPVGLKEPNAWGFHDLLGNAMEWCNDTFNGLGYGEEPIRDPEPEFAPAKGGVLRGGSGVCHLSATATTASRRCERDRWMGIPGFGLRLVRTLK